MTIAFSQALPPATGAPTLPDASTPGSTRRPASWALRLGAIALVTLVALNLCFVAIRLADGWMPKAQTAAMLRTGFAHDALGLNPWPKNALQGRDRYSDCIAAQIAVLGDETPLRNALAPRLMSPERLGHSAIDHNACAELLAYLEGRAQPQPGVTYTRFWHGASSALVAASAFMPLDGYRALLLDLTLALIATIAVCAALAGREFLIALAPLLIASFAFGGQMGYGQLVSHGPAMVAAWSIALALVIRRRNLTDAVLVGFAVAAGAAEAFLDQMIGVPLAAAIFVIVAGTLTRDRDEAPGRALTRVAWLIGAWGFGLVGSYAIKLGLSTLVIGSSALQEFGQQLAYRAGTADPEVGLDPVMGASRLSVMGLALLQACRRIWQLGYTDAPGLFGQIVGFVGIIGWALAVAMWIAAIRAGQGVRHVVRGAGYIGGALVILGWFLVFPEHAFRHAFTVRCLVVWIVGGWGWAASDGPRRASRRPRGRACRSRRPASRSPADTPPRPASSPIVSFAPASWRLLMRVDGRAGGRARRADLCLDHGSG